jgi:hypothetical protein
MEEFHMRQAVKLISVGRHTRLGDILERAVTDISFETIRSDDVAKQNLEGERLLFAVSSDEFGENEALSALTRDVLSGKCSLADSVCAVIGDGERGGALHADLLKLLFALNGAGCAIMNHPCVEGSRDLKNLSSQTGDESTPPFELYRRQAESLVGRLLAFEPAESGNQRIRFASALESEGAARDWLEALGKEAAAHGAKLVSADDPADATLLLCENTRNTPDEATMRLIDSFDACTLSCIVASPRFGAEFYCMQILEQACLQGGCSLLPYAFTIYDGISAAQAFAVGAMFEKARNTVAKIAGN